MLYELVFAIDLLFEHIYHEVFGLKHVLKVACEGVEAVVGVLLGLFLINAHSALTAYVCALALLLLVAHDINTHDFLSAVDAGHHDVRTCSLMHFNVFAETLRFAYFEGLALYRLILTVLVMVLDFLIGQYLVTSELLVVAHELH